MAKTKISTADIEKTIGEQVSIYSSEVAKKVLKSTQSTMRKFVKLSKEKAPKRSGNFKSHIASIVEDNNISGAKGIWYVKDPDYRLTHLLVNGHQNRDGTRTKGNPFLEDALSEIADEYIKEMEKAAQND